MTVRETRAVDQKGRILVCRNDAVRATVGAVFGCAHEKKTTERDKGMCTTYNACWPVRRRGLKFEEAVGRGSDDANDGRASKRY